MTRRTAILLGLGLPAIFPLAGAAKEFWNERKPDEWTDEEREILLTKSPWAREANVDVNVGGGGLSNSRSTNNRGGGMMTRRGSSVPMAQDTGTTVNPGRYEAIVRWESALPIREANHNQLKDDPAGNYILSVVGDLPMLSGGGNDETDTEFQQRLDMLKEFSKLEKRGDPIYLVKVGRLKGPPGKSGTLFYFERNDLIRLDDHTVTFVTKLGPLSVKCKFPLHEMVYQGKLEL
jgi:hypothetical protein